MSCARLFLGTRPPNADFVTLQISTNAEFPDHVLFYLMETPASTHHPKLNNLGDRAERVS